MNKTNMKDKAMEEIKKSSKRLKESADEYARLLYAKSIVIDEIEEALNGAHIKINHCMTLDEPDELETYMLSWEQRKDSDRAPYAIHIVTQKKDGSSIEKKPLRNTTIAQRYRFFNHLSAFMAGFTLEIAKLIEKIK